MQDIERLQKGGAILAYQKHRRAVINKLKPEGTLEISANKVELLDFAKHESMRSIGSPVRMQPRPVSPAKVEIKVQMP